MYSSCTSYSRQYMDDTFIVFDNSDQANNFFTYLNSKHPKTKFTIETEKENKLPFLDLLTDKPNTELNISIYRRPTHTNLGVNFQSVQYYDMNFYFVYFLHVQISLCIKVYLYFTVWRDY